MTGAFKYSMGSKAHGIGWAEEQAPTLGTDAASNAVLISQAPATPYQQPDCTPAPAPPGLRFGSVCSGIEAASVAWEPLGFRAAWLAEIEKFPAAVLAHHWPNTPNLGDMTQIPEYLRLGILEAPDVLVGGTPCQAFSVAGLREGLADERGQLTLKYVEILNELDRARDTPAVAVWENVPGVLNSKDNAFGCFLGAIVGEDCELQPAGKRWSNAGCVFGPQRTAAWRVLDAQYFGVAQRRRRVFVVASARDGFDPCEVLFECEGVRRDSPPSRSTGPAVAALTANGVGTCGADDNQRQAGHLIGYANAGHFGTMKEVDASDPLRAKGGDTGNGGETPVCLAHGQAGAEIGIGIGTTLNCNHEAPIVTRYGDIAGALTARHDSSPCADRGQNVLAFSCKDYGADVGVVAPTLRAMGHSTSHPNAGGQLAALTPDLHVRRLTVVECARLQGFPDDHTLLPYGPRKKLGDDYLAYLRQREPGLTITAAKQLAADGPQYKAYGNSMAVPVMHWIGERIKEQLI